MSAITTDKRPSVPQIVALSMCEALKLSCNDPPNGKLRIVGLPAKGATVHGFSDSRREAFFAADPFPNLTSRSIMLRTRQGMTD